MKKILMTTAVTALLISAGFYLLPPLKTARVPQVCLAVAERSTVYESVDCAGTVFCEKEAALAPGAPARITRVLVEPGQSVEEGEILFEYRLLSGKEAAQAFAGTFYGELERAASGLSASGSEILDAAEHYAVTGELPEDFRLFYVPESAAEKGGCAIAAPFSGKVISVSNSAGDTVTGLFPTVTMADTEDLSVKIKVPERFMAKVKPGQQVNVYGGAGLVEAGRVTFVKDYAETSGGLLTAAETVVSASVSLSWGSKFMRGATVRAVVFTGTFRDAVVIPYEAVRQDEEGEFVFLFSGGRAEKRYIDSVFESDEGVIPGGGFSGEELFILNPPETLEDGSAVAAVEH